ncbi:uncharacterized protein K460DRAFT_363852 [Cucurbitaria berberidis CBS 394.84]|uniref:Uncharacterized protein n=1 Tax=Cucurbitaria berberidis CBS 394.84 TaxID=1168544 RepID=A0A9P4GML5_9PLEO|nr:uncharacterized protein K460DRAFT_363852 [Cucurbitaria berberidis CBS 394.84]KAF1847826.1 hypothetical protein K460DRAFT_363852 [Cucurbitaria berberidis CBS 394.84]
MTTWISASTHHWLHPIHIHNLCYMFRFIPPLTLHSGSRELAKNIPKKTRKIPYML